MILRENYRSVLAAEGMKEALERMDSALLFAIGGQEDRAREQFAEYRPVFEQNLEIEQGNVTLPGEQEMADDLTSLYGAIRRAGRPLLRPARRAERTRTELYFARAAADLQRDQATRPTRCSTSTRGTWRTRTGGPARRPRCRSG